MYSPFVAASMILIRRSNASSLAISSLANKYARQNVVVTPRSRGASGGCNSVCVDGVSIDDDGAGTNAMIPGSAPESGELTRAADIFLLLLGSMVLWVA